MSIDWWRWLWYRLFVFALRRLKSGYHLCANRNEQGFVIRQLDVTVIFRDTTKPDAYSREECIEMLTKVRIQELASGWTCPDPKDEMIYRQWLLKLKTYMGDELKECSDAFMRDLYRMHPTAAAAVARLRRMRGETRV